MSLSVVNRKINLQRIAHVNYTHKDLDTAHQLLLDFGLSLTKRSNEKFYYCAYLKA